MVETLYPTQSYEDNSGGGYVLDGASAFDQDDATYSRIVADQDMEFETQIMYGFSADAIPGARMSVVIELDLARFLWTEVDQCIVFFRPTASVAFVGVAAYRIADLEETATVKTIDVSALAGALPATGFEVAVQFANDFPGDPPFPVDPV